jgi:hypothetical protein
MTVTLRNLQAALAKAAYATCIVMAFTNLLQARAMMGAAKLDIQEGRPVVDGVYVNGHGPYRFLLDTGANVNLIESKLAKTIGVQPTIKDELASTSGTAAVSGADGLEIELDSVKADRQLFIFSDLKAIHNLASDIRGVLGQTFLSRFDYLLDFRNKRLEFGKREVDGARVSFQMINARPAIATDIGVMILDSGTDSVFIFGAEPSTVPQSVRTVSGFAAAGTVSRTISINGRVVWNGEAVAMPRQAKESGDGLLPASIFKAIYVCNSERYIVFK